jgi:hypothetical protein
LGDELNARQENIRNAGRNPAKAAACTEGRKNHASKGPEGKKAVRGGKIRGVEEDLSKKRLKAIFGI